MSKQCRHSQRFSCLCQESFYKHCNLHAGKVPTNQQVFNVSSEPDPTAIGHCASYACLKKLADFFPTILTSTEKTDNYLKEISTLQLDGSLPSALEENDGQRFFKLATIQFYHKWLKLLVFQFVFQNTN